MQTNGKVCSPSPVKDLETTVAQSFLQPKDGPGTTGSSAKMLFSKDWTTTVTFAFSHQVWMTTPQIPILKIPQPGKLGETKCSFEQKLLQVVNHPPVRRWTEVCFADPHRRNATEGMPLFLSGALEAHLREDKSSQNYSAPTLNRKWQTIRTRETLQQHKPKATEPPVPETAASPV